MSRVSRPMPMHKDALILDVRTENLIYHALGEGIWRKDRPTHIDWYTLCGKSIGGSVFGTACLPRWRAGQIARPCKRCYPEATKP